MASVLKSYVTYAAVPYQRADGLDVPVLVDSLFESICDHCGVPIGPRNASPLPLPRLRARAPSVCAALVSMGYTARQWQARAGHVREYEGYETILLHDQLLERLDIVGVSLVGSVRATLNSELHEFLPDQRLPVVGADGPNRDGVSTRRCPECLQLIRMPHDFLDVAVEQQRRPSGVWFASGLANRVSFFLEPSLHARLFPHAPRCDQARIVPAECAFPLDEIAIGLEFEQRVLE